MSVVSLDVNGFFDHVAGEAGIRRQEVENLAPRVAEVLRNLEAKRGNGELPFYELPYDANAVAAASDAAAGLRERFESLVVLGIGGSALGTRAAVEAVHKSQCAADALNVEVLDNVDPTTIADLLDRLDLKTTVFNVISKSGQTAETMSQFLLVRDRLLRELGAKRYRDNIIFTTDAESGLLRQIAQEEGFRTFPVPAGVGGRFSVLSAVGLLPIAAAGVDIAALCQGAREADERCRRTDIWHNPAALHAALLHIALEERGAGIHVLMPYADGLLSLAEWYAQLWAESLGKRLSLQGDVVETGQTPVRALGATDQHSQVQLYVEGPHDKVVSFIRVQEPAVDLQIPSGYDDIEGIAYLSGHTFGDLLNMEQTATELALGRAGRLTSTYVVDSLDASAVGQLFHTLECQTLVMGGLLGVDPLDQPGVEAGKLMTYALAGRGGYEDEAAAVKDRLALKKDELVID